MFKKKTEEELKQELEKLEKEKEIIEKLAEIVKSIQDAKDKINQAKMTTRKSSALGQFARSMEKVGGSFLDYMEHTGIGEEVREKRKKGML